MVYTKQINGPLFRPGLFSCLKDAVTACRVKQNTANRPDLRAPIYLLNDFRYHLIYDRHPNPYPWS